MGEHTRRLALISGSDKSNVTTFAAALVRHGYTIVSTGGTLRTLRESNVEVLPVDQLTGFPEMMDGRVKTLHPAVHGGILARTTLAAHAAAMSAA